MWTLYFVKSYSTDRSRVKRIKFIGELDILCIAHDKLAGRFLFGPGLKIYILAFGNE